MTKGEWLKLFSFFYAIIQKNINFLRRSSKKDDFIIENIFEEGNIIDDKKIIELYFERNEQAIKETDIKYEKLCHKFELGNEKLEICSGAGHTAGCITVLFKNARILLTGDVANNGTYLFDTYSLPVSAYKKAMIELKNNLKENMIKF